MLLETVPAVAANVAVVLPAETTTEAGTVSCEDGTAVIADNAIVAPPAGAAPDSVTVQVEIPDAEIVAGLQASDDSVIGAVTGGAPGLSTRPALFTTPL